MNCSLSVEPAHGVDSTRDLVGEPNARRRLEHASRRVLVAGVGGAERYVAAVPARLIPVEREQSGRVQLVDVDERTRVPVFAALDIEHGLRRGTTPQRVKEPFTRRARDAVRIERQQLAELLGEGLASRKRI